MKKETVDIIADLVANIPLNIDITNVVDNLDGTFTCSVCNTLYLSKGFSIVINLVEYQIVSVLVNESFIVSGSIIPPVIKFALPALYFFHGTILQTNLENTRDTNVFNRTPMVYLGRPFTETIDPLDQNNVEIERESNVSLFFLTQADFEKWMTVDHDINAIKPMRNVMYAFIDSLKIAPNNKIVARLSDTYTATDKIKFGIYVPQKGVETFLWNDKLSGVQCDITIPIRRQCDC